MAMKKKVVPTEEQLKELKKLAKALKASEQVREIRARLKGFVEENLDALVDGIEVDGMTLEVKLSKTLYAEEA